MLYDKRIREGRKTKILTKNTHTHIPKNKEEILVTITVLVMLCGQSWYL